MKAVIVGMGSMGKNHYRILKTIPYVEIAAVCDPEFNEKLDVPVYSHISSLLREIVFDFAVVAVPTTEHVEVATILAERGINFLLEKPVAQNVEQAERILKTVTYSNVKAAVGHIERCNPVISSLINELKGQTIFSITITRVGPFPPRIKDVGVLVDMSVHDVDLVRFITGSNPKETQIHKSIKINGCFEDNAVILMNMDNETFATITTNWITPFKRRRVEVTTDKAYYEADLISQELVEYSAYKPDGSHVIRNCRVKKGEPLDFELKAFVDYLKTGFRGNLASLEDGIETLRVIDHAGAVAV